MTTVKCEFENENGIPKWNGCRRVIKRENWRKVSKVMNETKAFVIYAPAHIQITDANGKFHFIWCQLNDKKMLKCGNARIFFISLKYPRFNIGKYLMCSALSSIILFSSQSFQIILKAESFFIFAFDQVFSSIFFLFLFQLEMCAVHRIDSIILFYLRSTRFDFVTCSSSITHISCIDTQFKDNKLIKKNKFKSLIRTQDAMWWQKIRINANRTGSNTKFKFNKTHTCKTHMYARLPGNATL